MSLKRNIWLAYINGIELQYMLNICWITLFEQVIAIWLVGFNLTFNVHKKAWTFTLLNPHYTYTVIMALAFSSHLLPASLVYSKSVDSVFIALFVEYLYAFFYIIICVYTCWKPVVLEKQFFLFHVLDLNPIFANEDPPQFKTKKFLHLPLREP